MFRTHSEHHQVLENQGWHWSNHFAQSVLFLGHKGQYLQTIENINHSSQSISFWSHCSVFFLIKQMERWQKFYPQKSYLFIYLFTHFILFSKGFTNVLQPQFIWQLFPEWQLCVRPWRRYKALWAGGRSVWTILEHLGAAPENISQDGWYWTGSSGRPPVIWHLWKGSSYEARRFVYFAPCQHHHVWPFSIIQEMRKLWAVFPEKWLANQWKMCFRGSQWCASWLC